MEAARRDWRGWGFRVLRDYGLVMKARRHGEEDDFAVAIWVTGELREEVMVARGDGSTVLGFGGGKTVVMATLVVHGGAMRLLEILGVYGGCRVARGIGDKRRIGKDERLSFWKVPGAKEVMERGIGNRMDEVAMSLNNSQHRVLEAEKGIEAGHLPFLDKDIRNFIKSQSSIDKENDASGVGVAVNIRNQVGEEARMRQKYHNPLMKTSFPIEEHAASILTPYAFELLQHEIELSTKYAATVINNDSYLVRHHTKLDGGRSVTWIKEKNSIRCSCKQFEFSGILCRHAIRVLLKNDYFSIPEEYLLSRWRRESSLIPQSRHMINYNDNSSIEFRSLVQCLEVESLKTKDRVEVATKELKKVIHYLKGMPDVQENSIDLEHGVLNVDECDVENPITSKTKGRPRGSRAKGGVEAAKKSRHCHYPNCGGTDHDSRNCPIKRKKDSLLASQSSPNK
ncbi:Protein FAR1-RELATED SEQUENCE 11 [Vigna angularis]|uniref:Protein FAR1-RELATED SEQUENCE n=1 Tax=Phaseolus angularis TaxID=3914 RepID=A0A8T0K5A3_PHAAN|nr:Protein FAR1-RELATED SEQUENCE 11 [Vigna angularis]